MKKILKIIGIIVFFYLIVKIATRPVVILEVDTDPTGKIWIEQEKDREYQEYMEERGFR